MKRRFVLVVLAVSLAAGFLVGQATPQQISFAQEETMIRFYVMPIQVINDVYRVPKYLKSRWYPEGIPVVRWAMKDYGLIDAALIAVELTQAQHEQLVAEPDVAAAPVDINQNISEIAIPQVQNVMEALRIPADWITSEYTYRDVLRMIGGLFLFAQTHHRLHDEVLIDSTAQLDLRWNQIPQGRKDRIMATADQLGYDYSEVQPTWLVRAILWHLAQQWADTPISFGFVTL